MVEMTIGIVPAPDFPASTAEAMKDTLAQSLSEVIDQHIKWYVAVQISSLIGTAERVGVRRGILLRKDVGQYLVE